MKETESNVPVITFPAKRTFPARVVHSFYVTCIWGGPINMQNSRMIKVLSGEVQGKRKGGIVPGWRQILMASLIYLSRTAGTWLRYFSCCLREGRGLPALPRWFDCMICCCRLLMYSFTPSKVLCCSNALSFLVWALSASGQSITEPPVFLFEGVLSQTLTLCACKRNCLKVSTWTRPPPVWLCSSCSAPTSK